jgi:hypothetical protein
MIFRRTPEQAGTQLNSTAGFDKLPRDENKTRQPKEKFRQLLSAVLA